MEFEKNKTIIQNELDSESLQLNKMQEILEIKQLLNEKLILLEADEKILSEEEAKINQELQSTIHFASSQYLDEESIRDLLYYKLDGTIPSKKYLKQVYDNIIQNCDWKKISKVYNVDDLVFILMSFYHQHIKNNLHTEGSEYSHLFDQFLIENAIPIENKIHKKEIAKTRMLDSLARLIWFYSRYKQKETDIGNFIAITIHHGKLKIANNEGDQDNEAKRKLIHDAINWITDIIKNCTYSSLSDHKNFVFYFLKHLQLPVKKKCPKKVMDRLQGDLLNILQFNSVHNLSLGKKLAAVTDDDIYISNGTYLPSIRKTHYLHADLLLLKSIAIPHILNCEKNSNKLTLFPENEPIILGMNKLNNIHSFMFIKTLNDKSNSNIISTGTQHVSAYKRTDMSFMCGTFFERMQTEIEQKKSDISLDDSNYKSLMTFLRKQSGLFSSKMKYYNNYALIHSCFFNPKNPNNKSTLARRFHSLDPNPSPMHDHDFTNNKTHYSTPSKKLKLR